MTCLSNTADQLRVIEPYLASLYYPFRVKIIFGCDALQEPTEGREGQSKQKNLREAVGSAWIHSWLPDCASQHKPADCFNILHEIDFRAFPQDCYALEMLYRDYGWDPYWKESASSESFPGAKHWFSGERPDGLPRYFPDWLKKFPDTRQTGDLSVLANEWMRQTHRLTTAAHRWTTPKRPNGSGELICFSWKPFNKGAAGIGKPSTHRGKPARWNGMWGITTRCARKILEIWACLQSGF